MEFQQVVQQRRMVRRFASTPIGSIAVGHPATQEGPRGSAARRKRKPMEDVVHYGRWS